LNLSIIVILKTMFNVVEFYLFIFKYFKKLL